MAFATVVNMSATARQLFSSYERQTARDRVLKAPPPRTHSLGCFFVSIGFKKGLIKTNARVIKHYDCYFHSYKFWSSPNYVKTAHFNGPDPNALDLNNLRLTNHIWISWYVNNRVLFWSKNLCRSILYEWKTDFTVDTNIGAQSLHRPYSWTESADFASLSGNGRMIVGLLSFVSLRPLFMCYSFSRSISSKIPSVGLIL